MSRMVQSMQNTQLWVTVKVQDGHAEAPCTVVSSSTEEEATWIPYSSSHQEPTKELELKSPYADTVATQTRSPFLSWCTHPPTCWSLMVCAWPDGFDLLCLRGYTTLAAAEQPPVSDGPGAVGLFCLQEGPC